MQRQQTNAAHILTLRRAVMGPSKRWIDNTIEEANKCETKMPWELGLRRQAMISRRL
jgi:hypothetical protein